MKSAIDKLEQTRTEAAEDQHYADHDDFSNQEDSYGEGDDAEGHARQAQQTSEEEEMEAKPVKNKRSSPVKPRQQDQEGQPDQAQVERLRVHYKRQKLEGEGNLGIVCLMEPAEEKDVNAKSDFVDEQDAAISNR